MATAPRWNDPTLQATMLSQTVRPKEWAMAMLAEVIGRVTVFFRLQKNLTACKVRITDLQARNQRIEDYMAAHKTRDGQKINWVR